MSEQMETAALVAPVTALEFLQEDFLLTGEGPVLKVYSLQPHPKARASLSVLRHYRIHGIRPKRSIAAPPQSSTTGTHENKTDELISTSQPVFYDLAVFGGKAVRLVRLHVENQDEECLRLEILGPLMELQDWALDARWLSGDQNSLLCVAVAHNSALLLDVITGNSLVQRSCLEGCLLYSAFLLVHDSWEDTVLVGGTVFNQLILWRPGGGDKGRESEYKAPVERRLLGHSGVIFCISYLQERGWLASASDDRSVRVWGVGSLGGPGGMCGDLTPTCLRVLYGHQARVFSVCLSPTKVFSAGEDGACLVWDWAGGGKVVRTLKGHRAGGVRALAVSGETGSGERWAATGGADGGVRLWRVEEKDAITDNLSDLRFPGRGLPKEVCIAGEEDENASWSQSKLVVCTDQGLVYQYRDGQWEMVWQGTPEFQSYCVMESATVSVNDSAAKVSLCAVGNLTGSIQVFPISHPQCGVLLTGGSGKIHSLIWQEARESLYLLASGAEGFVHRWCIKVGLEETSSMTLHVRPLSPFLLPACAKRWLTAALLQSTPRGPLWVCGDRRGSLLLFQDRGQLEQQMDDDKKREDVEIKEVVDRALHPLSCLFGVHGKQGVTSVCAHQGLLYSTGRDGCVRVFRVHPTAEKLEEKGHGENVEDKEGLGLEVLRVQRACKGMEWLERVLFLEPDISVKEEEEEEEEEREPGGEGEKSYQTKRRSLRDKLEDTETEEKRENRGREARFVIVGFHAVQFVVWDPVRQEKLLAVPCGGGHRSWSLWPSNRGVWPGYGALVFIKQGAVLTSQPPGEEPSRDGEAGSSGGLGLREGVHGRGIGCVCRVGRIKGIKSQTERGAHLAEIELKNRNDEGHWEIVATGGEDTSVTVLAIHPDSGSIKVLSVITDHISSVRTLTALTGEGGRRENRTQSFSALLVSAGGRAQMQCYRLLISWDVQRKAPSCQVIQVASHRLDEQWERRRDRHKTVKMDPETRYMSVVVVDEKTDCVLLAVACSDGAIRLFSVSEGQRQIELLCETFYHKRCVLSVAPCSLEDGKGNRYNLLFSAATDGKIAVWDFTEASFLSTDVLSNTPDSPVPRLVIPAHQSGINSLAVWKEKLEQQQGGCLVTVASGGDDGQLTVSRVRVQYPDEGKTEGFKEPLLSQQAKLKTPDQLNLSLNSQSHIPLAHAAPLTDLKFLSPGLLLSTSSDQRVFLWRISSTGISHSRAVFSHVADAAGLSAWEGEITQEEEETRFESEQETAISRQKERKTGLKTMCETSGRISKDKGAAGEHVETVSESSDPLCASSNGEKGTDSVGKTECEVSDEIGCRAHRKSKTRTEKTGWVLVCGQGFQLLRVKNPDMDEET